MLTKDQARKRAQELIKAQGKGPIQDPKELQGNWWPEDQDKEAWLKMMHDIREQSG